MAKTSPLASFRELLTKKGIDVYILPRTDEHQSEYICPCDQRLAFISSFTGSNGIAVISQKQALMWTDGRYFLQAENQLAEGWELRKMKIDQLKWFEYVVKNYQKGTKIQIDGRLISAKIAGQRKATFESAGMEINFAESNLIDEVWTDRCPSSATHIFVHQLWAGKSLTEKIQWVQKHIQELKGEAALFTDLGQIAWILNLRSSQIPFNPLFKSILLVTLNGGTLYLPKNHPSQKNEEVSKHLLKAKIIIKPYNPEFPQKVLCEAEDLNYCIYSKIKTPIAWCGINLYRAVRTDKQINGFKRCHIADGIAMAKFWTWRSKKDEVDQYEAATYLDNLRMQQQHNRGISFETISAGGPNGAVIHYHPTDKRSSIIKKDMVHLVDSGGQYLDGTTDVTRAFHFGTPLPQQKSAFTRVLLGNLDIERIKWSSSQKLTGANIDILARHRLWDAGQCYAHGTGHGVGYYGSVHEGPVGISKRNAIVYQPNMVVTNEPGYYENGKFGIRIENVLVVKKMQNNMLEFQNITYCPYDKNLLDSDLLSNYDKEYINKYHRKVWDTISPHIENDAQATQWLKNATSPI